MNLTRSINDGLFGWRRVRAWCVKGHPLDSTTSASQALICPKPFCNRHGLEGEWKFPSKVSFFVEAMTVGWGVVIYERYEEALYSNFLNETPMSLEEANESLTQLVSERRNYTRL